MDPEPSPRRDDAARTSTGGIGSERFTTELARVVQQLADRVATGADDDTVAIPVADLRLVVQALEVLSSPEREHAAAVIASQALSAAALIEGAAAMLDHLVMDTPQDQALSVQVATSMRASAAGLRTWSNRVATGPSAKEPL